MTDTGFANVEVDFVLSGATSVLTTTVDALLTKTNQTLTTTVDADLVRNLTVTVDALVVDADGTFRGSFTETDRDDLPALQAQDTVITTDAAFESAGTEVAQAQYWTGAAWLSGRSMASPSSGLNRLFVAPTTAGWRVELGDPTYPIRYWNGSITRFSVDDAGDVFLTGSLSAGAIDIPDDSSAGFHVDSSGNFATGATSATDTSAAFSVTTSGTIHATKDLMLFTTGTSFPGLDLSGLSATIAFGPGSGGTDTTIQRTAAGILQIGNLFEFQSASAPSAPASTRVRLYDNGGTLYWKNATTTYDLSAGSSGVGLTITTHAGAVSDSDFVAPVSGNIGLDTTNSRLYLRVGSTWKYVEVS